MHVNNNECIVAVTATAVAATAAAVTAAIAIAVAVAVTVSVAVAVVVSVAVATIFTILHCCIDTPHQGFVTNFICLFFIRVRSNSIMDIHLTSKKL